MTCRQDPHASTARCIEHNTVPDWGGEYGGPSGWLCPEGGYFEVAHDYDHHLRLASIQLEARVQNVLLTGQTPSKVVFTVNVKLTGNHEYANSVLRSVEIMILGAERPRWVAPNDLVDADGQRADNVAAAVVTAG